MDKLYVCSDCGKQISKGVFDYSVNSFLRTPLCIADQLKAKQEILEDRKYKWGENL